MRRYKDEKFVFDDGEEDEDMKDPVAIKDGKHEDEDDDEGNEDLSLKILEKALSRRDVVNKLDSDLSDSGVVSTVIVNGGKSKAKKDESSKKMKRIKLEAANEIPLVWKDLDDEEKVVKDVVKGEEEDDNEVEKSAEPKTGETASNMVLKKLLRGARYFDPPDAGWVSCYSCGEQGHITVNCPTPMKRRKPCFICGSLEHGARQCSKGHDCYICKKGGHRAKDCPDKYRSGSKGAVCLRCGDFGHEMILCKYEYSKEDLKDIQCYVCKGFGHLCCVEPDNSLSWAVSCYRCGQHGHTGLGCGRHFDESNEQDYVSSSCFRCGEEGHLKRDCPNSSSVTVRENIKESPSACFRCGEEGHISRECPNSSSISTSQGSDTRRCYKCRGAGHFARECPYSSQVSSKREREPSTPSSHKSHKKSKENSEHISTPHESTPSRKSSKKNKENSEHDSTPHESNGKTKKKKKKKTHKEEQLQTSSPRKPKHRGGWMTEEPEEESFERGHMRRPRSPITPSTYNHRERTTHHHHHHHHQHHHDQHHHQHHHDQHHHHHHQHHRHERSPSRYGGAHHYGEYEWNYERR